MEGYARKSSALMASLAQAKASPAKPGDSFKSMGPGARAVDSRMPWDLPRAGDWVLARVAPGSDPSAHGTGAARPALVLGVPPSKGSALVILSPGKPATSEVGRAFEAFGRGEADAEQTALLSRFGRPDRLILKPNPDRSARFPYFVVDPSEGVVAEWDRSKARQSGQGPLLGRALEHDIAKAKEAQSSFSLQGSAEPIRLRRVPSLSQPAAPAQRPAPHPVARSPQPAQAQAAPRKPRGFDREA